MFTQEARISVEIGPTSALLIRDIARAIRTSGAELMPDGLNLSTMRACGLIAR